MRGIVAVGLLVVSNAFADTGVVRAYRVQIAARTFRDGRYRAAELGNRPSGILLPGPGQPHRLGAVRRSVFHLGAQGHPGGCLALGLHRFSRSSSLSPIRSGGTTSPGSPAWFSPFTLFSGNDSVVPPYLPAVHEVLPDIINLRLYLSEY